MGNPLAIGYSDGKMFCPLSSEHDNFDSGTSGEGRILDQELPDGTLLIGELLIGPFSGKIQSVHVVEVIDASSLEGEISGRFIESEYEDISFTMDRDESQPFNDGDLVSFDVTMDGDGRSAIATNVQLLDENRLAVVIDVNQDNLMYLDHRSKGSKDPFSDPHAEGKRPGSVGIVNTNPRRLNLLKNDHFLGQVWTFDGDFRRVMLQVEDASATLDFEATDIEAASVGKITEDCIVSFAIRVDHYTAYATEVRLASGSRRQGILTRFPGEFGSYGNFLDNETGHELSFRLKESYVEPSSIPKLADDKAISYELKFEHPDVVAFNIRVED